jgi:hypothetical protein
MLFLNSTTRYLVSSNTIPSYRRKWSPNTGELRQGPDSVSIYSYTNLFLGSPCHRARRAAGWPFPGLDVTVRARGWTRDGAQVHAQTGHVWPGRSTHHGMYTAKLDTCDPDDRSITVCMRPDWTRATRTICPSRYVCDQTGHVRPGRSPNHSMYATKLDMCDQDDLPITVCMRQRVYMGRECETSICTSITSMCYCASFYIIYGGTCA